MVYWFDANALMLFSLGTSELVTWLIRHVTSSLFVNSSHVTSSPLHLTVEMNFFSENPCMDARGVAKYSGFGPIELRCITEMVQDRR